MALSSRLLFLLLAAVGLLPLAAHSQTEKKLVATPGDTGVTETAGSARISGPTLTPPPTSFGSKGLRLPPGTAPNASTPRPGTRAPYFADTQELPAPEPSEFQTFIAESTGRILPRYGIDLFAGVPSTFAPVDNIPMTLDYVIGPGDEILIRVWGQIDGEHRVAVERDGTINIPRVGTISVSGIKLQDLQGYVRSAIARNYQNFELSVSLGQLRSIQIFVVGQATRPGSYVVSSLSTLVSALFASGGPSNTGSMRRIQLKRDDKTISEFDVYDFLSKGDKSKDARLLPGDVIFVPPEGQLVAISGSVKVPAIYELKDRTSLADVLALAGGLATTAAGQKVLLERIEDRRIRRVDEFSLDQTGLARTVKDGDLISVMPLSAKFDNAVTLRGNVAMPLRHPYRDGMRITDLIPERNALIVADYYTRQNRATRITPKNEEKAREEIKLTGSEKSLARDDKLLTEIRRSGAEINWDYALIERLDPITFSPVLLPFDLGKAVLDRDPAQNLLLKPGDVVTIFAKSDFGVPRANRTSLVVLEEEFRRPGIYKAEPGETLRQLVVRVGGLTPNAYLFGAEFTRESTRVAQQKSLDEAIARLELDSQRSLSLKAQSGASSDNETIAQQIAAQQAVIARLRQLRASGRIVLKQSGQNQLTDIPDLPLEDGDRLKIPAAPSSISVIGSVYNESAFVYNAGLRVADYLAQAGGPLKSADVGATYLLRADGTIVSKRTAGWLTGSFESQSLMPGDAIVVPEDFDRTTWTKTLKDWGQILYQFGLGAAAIKVLK